MAVPRISALLMLRSTISTVSAPATCLFRGSITNPTQLLCTLRGRRYRRLTQHLLPGGPLRPYPDRSCTGWTAPAFVGAFVAVGARGWDRDRARPAVGEGFPVLLFRLQGGFTVSPWRTFLDAPLKSRTARFPGSGSKPWHVRRVPSHSLERFKRWVVYTPAPLGLPTASPLGPSFA